MKTKMEQGVYTAYDLDIDLIEIAEIIERLGAAPERLVRGHRLDFVSISRDFRSLSHRCRTGMEE